MMYKSERMASGNNKNQPQVGQRAGRSVSIPPLPTELRALTSVAQGKGNLMTAKQNALGAEDKVEKRLQVFQKEAMPLARWMQVTALSTDNEYIDAAEARKKAKGLFEDAEDDRKSFTDPLNAVIKRINARYKVITEPAQTIIARTSALCLDYDRRRREEQMKIAEREAKKAVKQGAHELAEDIIQQAAVAKVVPQVDGIGTRRVYSARVVDEKKLPREYWLIDEKKLNAMARSLKGDLNVPGVELVVEEVMSGGRGEE